jgi:hypothetical protein
MRSCALASSEGEADEPKNEKNHGCDPQEMHRETQPEEKQDKQKCE